MKYLAFVSLLAIAGCHYTPPTVSVYGRSGTPYTAPSLCAALVKCLNSTETSCFYDRDMQQVGTGVQAMEECKEISR